MNKTEELLVSLLKSTEPCSPIGWIEVKGQVDMEDAVLGAHVVEFTRYFGLR